MQGNRSTLGVAMMLAASFATATAMGAIGPDVVHSDIQDVAKYGPVTVAGEPVHAYAWGSYTCNIGDANLLWGTTNNGTPALAMNAYRLHNGVLRQIGQSWVKRSCCAAEGTGCPGNPTCIPTPNTSALLGVGCRDIYSASYNGGQSRLMARSGVNAFTGFTGSVPPALNDTISRRIQVKQSDMTLATYPGAQYIGEGVYVASDEAPTGNAWNNASYKLMNVANTGATPTYQWSGASLMNVGTPAIYAWRDHGLGPGVPDNRVVVRRVDVPGEGIYHIGGKATDLGNGTWRYDYAVFNLNSDRAGATFAVPAPTGVQVTDIGFADIDYHSGEVYDNTDWNKAKVGTQVLWQSGQTFAQNQNANALRWGTMYNFWFTANQPPVNGQLELGLFKPGTPSSVFASNFPTPKCVSDVDNGTASGTPDGGVGIEDLLFYLAAFEAGTISVADVDNGTSSGIKDGGVGIEDLLYFLTRFEAGC